MSALFSCCRAASQTVAKPASSQQPEASYKIWKPIVLILIVTLGTLLAANYGFAETPDWQHLFKGNSIYPLIVGGALDCMLLGYLFYGIYQNRQQIANGTTPSSPTTTTTPSAAVGGPRSTSPSVNFSIQIHEINDKNQVLKRLCQTVTLREKETLEDLRTLFKSLYRPSSWSIDQSDVRIFVQGEELSYHTTIKTAKETGSIMIFVTKDSFK